MKGTIASMSITSVLGHLMGLEFDESYQKWQSCRPEDLFHAPIKKEVFFFFFFSFLILVKGESRYAKY